MSIDIDNAVTVGKNAHPTNLQVHNDGAVYSVVVGWAFQPTAMSIDIDNAVMVGKKFPPTNSLRNATFRAYRQNKKHKNTVIMWIKSSIY